MSRIAQAALVLFALIASAFAAELPAADKTAIQSVISGQLEAFSHDDADVAYGFAAPVVKQIFPTTGQFMAMVKQGYQPVYRNSGYNFGESFTDRQGNPAQRVFLNGSDGKRYEAVYTMQLQPDGSWKISGCYIAEVPGTDA